MGSSDSWTTIESDPGVFTELLDRIGVEGAEVQELYEVSGATLRTLEPVFGLIFLFKWNASLQNPKAPEEAPEIYFAKQVINNACATQAMLSILMNLTDDELNIGNDLKQLREFTADFPPDIRGITIGNADNIRVAHNSFAAPEAHLSDQETKQATEDDDVYHFVSYIHRNGSVWELDGLQSGPIKCCECLREEWLDRIGSIIEKRIALYSAKEIRFNLMALVKDQRKHYKAQIQALTDQLAAVENPELAAHRHGLQMKLERAEEVREQWHKENTRRKHNYVPFIFNFLQVLAEKDELLPLIAKYKEKPSA